MSTAIRFEPGDEKEVNLVPFVVKDQAPTQEALCAQPAAAGAPVKIDREQAWRQFAEKRPQYEGARAVIAHRILARTYATVDIAVQKRTGLAITQLRPRT